MSMKIYTDPKWIGKNWKMLSGIATLIAFLFGWVVGVNATVEGFPKLITRVEKAEEAVKEFKVYSGKFDTFLEMYRLQVLGRNHEAQDIARSLPVQHKP